MCLIPGFGDKPVFSAKTPKAVLQAAFLSFTDVEPSPELPDPGFEELVEIKPYDI